MKTVITHYRLTEQDYLLIPKKKGIPPSELLQYYDGQQDFTPSSRGGVTHITLEDEQGKCVATGISVCSLSDDFDFHNGFNRALLRAVGLINPPNIPEEYRS